MRITAEVNIDQNTRTDLYTDKEFDDMIFKDITIKFAQELRKMNPLFFKGDERNYTRYQMQAIVISMETFRNLMEELEDDLPFEKFDKIRSIYNNTL
jgi:hypothetical protein